MKDKPITGAVSHQAREIQELRADPELAAEYLKAAIEALNAPADRAAGLAALGTVVRMIAQEEDIKPLNAIDQAWNALAQRRAAPDRRWLRAGKSNSRMRLPMRSLSAMPLSDIFQK
jgi:hypothetical protein